MIIKVERKSVPNNIIVNAVRNVIKMFVEHIFSHHKNSYSGVFSVEILYLINESLIIRRLQVQIIYSQEYGISNAKLG